ncbi:MFS general substrate transporter, partial [Teratosphaeria nubilosa]
PKKGFQFWAIIASLCITAILGSLENTVVVTALPTIVRDLQIGDNYIWISNVFFLTSAAVQPLFGQLAQVFGRRHLAIAIVFVFTLGSGVCGAARNAATLIAGRAVQGVGSGGINSVIEMIVSDLVPLRERGNYMAIVLTVYSVGTTLGPWVGGAIVDGTTWRWV